MRIKGTKLSNRTLALLAAALLLLGTGGVFGSRAALGVQSDERVTGIATDSLSVALYEGSASNKLDDEATILEDLGDSVEPGRPYSCEVGVLNDGVADEYVRVIVRKYWTPPEGEDKDLELDPAIIELTTDSSNWNEVKGLSDEETIYYYKNKLASGESVPLITSLRIDDAVVMDESGITKETETSTVDGETVTITTYKYVYDGYTFTIEAEAQSVQTHSPEDAIKSIWGVDAGSTGINL